VLTQQAHRSQPGQALLGRLDQMEVVAYETPGLHLLIGLGTSLAQGSQEALAVCVATEDSLTMIAAVHDMVDSTSIFKSEFCCPARQGAGTAASCQY
jgi:hypothetical protein